MEPDVGKVAAVTLEVMSLRMELDMLIKVWTNGKADLTQENTGSRSQEI